MEGKIVAALVATAGSLLALSLVSFLVLLVHEIGAFCDDIMDPFQDREEND